MKLRICEEYNDRNMIGILNNVIDDFKYDFDEAEERYGLVNFIMSRSEQYRNGFIKELNRIKRNLISNGQSDISKKFNRGGEISMLLDGLGFSTYSDIGGTDFVSIEADDYDIDDSDFGGDIFD
jgi:hypothetical protein